MSSPHKIYLVDDDRDVREGLSFLMATSGLDVRSFESGTVFLDALPMLSPGCLVIDIRMPQLTGLHLQERLNAADCDWPVIIITGHGDIEACRRAFRSGAVDFLTKPIDEQVLLGSVKSALSLLGERVKHREGLALARRRLACRPPRRDQRSQDGCLQLTNPRSRTLKFARFGALAAICAGVSPNQRSNVAAY